MLNNAIQIYRQLARNQKGAMFGMDARIALVVASVLAAAGGVTIMSRLERSKVEQTEIGVELIRNALESHYRSTGITSLAADIDTLFTAGLIPDSTLTTDPYGNAWNYNTISVTKTINNTDVTVHLATIHSNGRDGVNDSTTIVDEADYASWEPSDDDIGAKFSTIEIEKERVLRYREQAQQIIDKLSAHESGRFLYINGVCPAGDDSHADCVHETPDPDVHHSNYNYYPKSSLDSSGATYLDPDVTGSYQTYTAGNSTDMQQLLSDIGLPTSFATDPWNRTLYYDSNITDRTSPPYSASICFSSAGSCF